MWVLGSSRATIRLLAAASLALSWSAPARAGVIVGDPSLPPVSGEYQTAADVHASYSGGALVMQTIRHFGFADIVRNAVGPDELETFQSTVEGQMTTPHATFLLTLHGPVQTIVHGKIGNTTGTFDTEMLSMSLSGFGLMIRESPTLASLGQTGIEDLGGGQFRVSSFFDVFTELSIDGGQSWMPSDGAARVTLVPEPGTLALAGLGAAMLAGWRRRGLGTRR